LVPKEPARSFQAGVDFFINDAWSFNIDAKKLLSSVDVSVNGGAITAQGTKIDPWVFGIGFAYTIKP